MQRWKELPKIEEKQRAFDSLRIKARSFFGMFGTYHCILQRVCKEAYTPSSTLPFHLQMKSFADQVHYLENRCQYRERFKKFCGLRPYRLLSAEEIASQKERGAIDPNEERIVDLITRLMYARESSTIERLTRQIEQLLDTLNNRMAINEEFKARMKSPGVPLLTEEEANKLIDALIKERHREAEEEARKLDELL
jgi:hypothetical protein